MQRVKSTDQEPEQRLMIERRRFHYTAHVPERRAQQNPKNTLLKASGKARH